MELKFLLRKGTALALACCISNIALADEALIVMPNCLQKAFKAEHLVNAQTNAFSLVQLSEQSIDKLAETSHGTKCGHFVNVTDEKAASQNPQHFLTSFTKPAKTKLLSDKLQTTHDNDEQIMRLIKQVDPVAVSKTLEGLTSFDDRYSRGEHGVEAAKWLQKRFVDMANDAGIKDFETYFVETGGSYIQPSLVTVIGKDKPGEAIILGAHMDTLSYHKPGADDDGSGTSSLMETARIILNAEKNGETLNLKRPLYFIWYSAEEMGLVGSQRVVKHFVEKKIPVKSVLQFDMTGYRYRGYTKMWMIDDHVDQGLSKFVENLIHQFVGVEVGHTRCNYSCSDHASWTNRGFRSAFPVEASFHEVNPYIHTSNDTMDHISAEHMANFSKLGIAFILTQQ